MAMPDFVGIGAQKAGTTWLYDMLSQNPSIWLPPLKEVHYFDSLKANERRRAARREHIRSIATQLDRGVLERGSEGDNASKAAFLRSLVGDHMLTPEWYGSIFDHPDARGRVAGEITPAYLSLGEGAMQRLAEMLPKTKFVLIIREPAARTASQLRMALWRARSIPENDEEWISFLDGIKSRGDYKTAIPRWQKYIAPERMLILPFSRVREEPAGLMREIEDFIGAERFDGYKSLDEPSHQTKEIVVPEWLMQTIKERSAPQKDYLIEAFGEEFYKNTR